MQKSMPIRHSLPAFKPRRDEASKAKQPLHTQPPLDAQANSDTGSPEGDGQIPAVMLMETSRVGVQRVPAQSTHSHSTLGPVHHHCLLGHQRPSLEPLTEIPPW